MALRLRYRILGAVSILALAALASLAFALSRNAPCAAPEPLADGAQGMKAIVQRCYGPPDVLEVETVAMPAIADDEVLVKVRSAAVNPLDWHYMKGVPYVMRLSSGLGRPESTRVGIDFSGTVEAVGGKVTRFKPGDAVFGGRHGAFAEYVAVREDRAITLKPDNISFEQAASAGIAAVTALQGLRDAGRIQPGHEVLINGASGGVGTFAVQMARSFGADVTGVCSTRNVGLVHSLGADRVIDYTREDFTRDGRRYDLILDNVGNRSFSELTSALKPDGILVTVGGPKRDPWLGPLARTVGASMRAPFVSQELTMLFADFDRQTLETVAALMREGKVTPVIDREYPLDGIAEAMAYLETGRARGKVVIRME